MTMTRQALGRGLGSLIPAQAKTKDEGNASGERIEQIPVENIFPSRFQPRTVFNKASLADLASSIKERGVIQPIIVTKKRKGYELIAGERRWRAVTSLGYKNIPAIVKSVRDSDALEMAIVENIQRENLNPVEEAMAYERLMNEFTFTQEKLAEKLGKSRSSVANLMRLLKLPDEIKDDLSDGKLTMGHARALLALSSDQERLSLKQEILSIGMNVRQVENRIKSVTKKKKSKNMGEIDLHMARAAVSMERRLGLKVSIVPKGAGGQIQIRFSDDEELNRVIDLIGAS